MTSIRLFAMACVLLCSNEVVVSLMRFERLMGKCSSSITFQCHPRKKTIKASKFMSRPIHNDDGPDPEEANTNISLRQSIQQLASIIDPTGTSLNNYLSEASSSSTSHHSIVHIIGTGVTPTLLNLPLSTLFLLSQADVVLYDSLGLTQHDIRRIVPDNCEVICVGKRGDQKSSSWKQGDIDQLLLQKAIESALLPSDDRQRTPKRTTSIVRLKGGDPFLFGRTRSEIDALRANNVPYTYTPGISSCIAGPHLGGIPLTDTSLDCQSFGVWSGTDALGRSWGLDDDSDDPSRSKFWQSMDIDVLVFLMIGRLDKLEALCQSIAHNSNGANGSGRWNKDTPCAVIQNAGGTSETPDEPTTIPVQRVWRSTLGNIVADIRKEDMNLTSVSPAVFVVGATATLDLLSQ